MGRRHTDLGSNMEQLKITLAHAARDWEPTLGLMLSYRDADPEVRKFIENCFPGFADGSINTLDILPDPQSHKSFGWKPPLVCFPMASSCLDDPCIAEIRVIVPDV
jgi:hypothetical protein